MKGYIYIYLFFIPFPFAPFLLFSFLLHETMSSWLRNYKNIENVENFFSYFLNHSPSESLSYQITKIKDISMKGYLYERISIWKQLIKIVNIAVPMFIPNCEQEKFCLNENDKNL